MDCLQLNKFRLISKFRQYNNLNRAKNMIMLNLFKKLLIFSALLALHLFLFGLLMFKPLCFSLVSPFFKNLSILILIFLMLLFLCLLFIILGILLAKVLVDSSFSKIYT